MNDTWLDRCVGESRCPYCGRSLIDDMEVGQGYCVTAPCWMYATGRLAEAVQWEREHGAQEDGGGD
jgi:hypothetical protein